MIYRKRALKAFFVLFFVLPGSVLAYRFASSYFEEPLLYSTGDHPLDVVAGDLNRDGDIDLLTANRDGRSISVYLGNGDGSLTELDPIETELGPTSLTLAYYDGDFDLDLIATVCRPGCTENAILIFRGLGNGQFETIAMVSASGVPYNILSADFDGNGLVDFAASDYPGNRIIQFMRKADSVPLEERFLKTGRRPIA
ncbi:MAG: VCBS repeat-containing protein, partial [Bdellovibrionales bacterium]|nr:VCBS repeat-containing protein [Bdellovibrionales bacterium]